MRNACRGIAAAYLLSIASAAAQEAAYDFRITANTMGDALSELARQAHVELLYPYQIARLRGVHTVVGRYTVTEALAVLLKGTGFSGGLTKQGIITISLRNEGNEPEGNAMSPEARKTLSLFSILLGTASAQVGLMQAAQAQDTGNDAAVETVVVTGFRESLANALDKKRHSNLIIEAVAPEDVGKMPDVNVAESLQRLPGVQIDRAGGEGTQVRIRGLSYNVTLLDGDVFVTGREMYTTGEGSGAGNGNLFQNSLEGIPSALISGVNVYKSPNASLVAGALGGTIDLTTRNPLDGRDGLSIGGNIGGSYAEGTDNMVPNGTIIAAYKYSSRFGVIAALSYDEHDVRIFEAQSQNRNGWTVAGPTTGVDNNIGTDYIEPELSYLTHQTVNRQRFGTFLGVQYDPIESLQTSLTWFHSFLTIQRVDITNKVFIHSNGEASGLDASEPYTIDPNGVVMLGTFRSNSAEGSTMVEKDRNIGDNIQFNVKYDDGGKFRFSAKFAYGSGKMYSEFVQADFRQSGYGISSANGDFSGLTGQIAGNNYANPLGCGGNSGTPSSTDCGFTYVNRSGLHPVVSYDVSDLLTNPEYVIFKSHWGWDVKSQNDQWSIRADAEYDVFDKVMVTGGLRYASKQVDYDFGRFLLNAYGDGTCSFTDSTHTAGVTMCPQGQGQLSWETDTTHRGPWTYYQDPSLPYVPVQTGTSNPERLVMVNDFFPTAGINKMLAQDPDPMLASPKAWLQSINPDAPLKRFKDAINSFKISRITTEGYFMIDLGDADDDLHVNTGVRVVNTLLKIGQYELAANPVYISTATWNGLPDISATTYGVTSRQYTDILPSLNVVYNVFDNQKVRFSAARVMAEQNYWDLGAGKYYNFTRYTGTARCNVNTSTSLTPGDAGCSTDGFYFNSGSSGNNQLDPYRANQIDLSYEYYFGKQGLVSVGLFWKGVESFTQTSTVSVTVDDDFGGTAGGVTQRTNGKGGRIQGIEFGAQYAFDMGLGFNLNYTYAQSSTANATDFDEHLGFPGVAQNAYTLQTYYEQGPIQARVSYTWKGKAVNPTYQTFAFASNSDLSTKTYGIYDRSYGQVDAQLSYNFLDHYGITLEARNLTAEATSSYLQFKNQPFLYNQPGRSYAVSLKFDF